MLSGDRPGRGRARRTHAGRAVATPGDCVDGFFEAYWRRPEALLGPGGARRPVDLGAAACGVEQRIVARLSAGLESGAWDAERGHLRERDAFAGALRLVVSQPG